MGMKWFQQPQTEVCDDCTQFTDVHQFIQESSLTLEVDAEMRDVADTFRGVENVYDVFHWGGSSGIQQVKNEEKCHKQVENVASDHTQFRANLVLQDARPVWRLNFRSGDDWMKLGESQCSRFLSYLWKILPQKMTSTKHSIELTEFARDLGNANSSLQTQ